MNRLRFLWVSVLGSLLLLTFQTANAGWAKTYGGQFGEGGSSVQQTRDGGYIVVGTRFMGAPREYDLWLLKTDSLGDTLWTRTYGKADWINDEGLCVREATDGGYIITGYTVTFITESEDLWLIRVDENGDTLWTRTWGGDYLDGGVCLEETSEGDYIIVGYRDYDYYRSDIWLLKTSSEGDTLWTRTYGGDMGDWVCRVQPTSDGGYIIVGFTESFSSEPIPRELWLLKTDENGDTAWTRRYGGGQMSEEGLCVRETNGGYIITGQKGGSLLLLRTDEKGDTLWTRTYGEGWDDRGYWVEPIADGGFIVLGERYFFNEGHYDVWLLKTDEKGDIVRSRFYGGKRDDWGNELDITSDGGYIIVGSTESFGGGTRDIWLIKTDSKGDTLSFLEEEGLNEGTNWEIVSSVGQQIVLRYSDSPQGFHAVIFDTTGRKVDELHATGASGMITWGKCYGPGVYFIVPSEGKASAQKVILIK